MIPKHRLETLVEQSLQFQKMNCLYHNTNEKSISLFTDHKCLRLINNNLLFEIIFYIKKKYFDSIIY